MRLFEIFWTDCWIQFFVIVNCQLSTLRKNLK